MGCDALTVEHNTCTPVCSGLSVTNWCDLENKTTTDVKMCDFRTTIFI